LIFDLDGTLVDSSRDLASAVNAALADLELPTRTLAEVLAFVGDGVRELVTRALPANRHDLIEEALARFERHYRRGLLDQTQPYPGIPDLLRQLGAMPLAIATNKLEKLSRRIVDGVDLASHFRKIVGGDSLPVRKPDPQIVLTIAADLGVRPENTLLVGDGVQDIEAARSAGAVSCGAGWGYRGAEILVAAGADVVIDAPAELLSVVAERELREME